MVAQIDLFKEGNLDNQHKIHGLAITSDGLRNDNNP